VKRRIIGGMGGAAKSNINFFPKATDDNEDFKKGKEETYLGLEKTAVAENATHDEEGRRKSSEMGDCVGRERVIYIFRLTKCINQKKGIGF